MNFNNLNGQPFSVEELLQRFEQQQGQIQALIAQVSTLEEAAAQQNISYNGRTLTAEEVVGHLESRDREIAALKSMNNVEPVAHEQKRAGFKVPMPETFEGKRTAHDVDSFLFHVRDYVSIMKVPAENQIQFVGSLMKGKALTWWFSILRQYDNGKTLGFEEALKFICEQYRPKMAKEQAEMKLFNLKMGKSYQRFEESFFELVQNIDDMEPKEQIRLFKLGLDKRYRFEIERATLDLKKNDGSIDYKGNFREMRKICAALETANQSSLQNSSSHKGVDDPMEIDALESKPVQRSADVPAEVTALLRKMPKPEISNNEREDCVKNHLCLGCKTKKHKGGWRSCYTYINSLGSEFKPVINHLKGFHKRH